MVQFAEKRLSTHSCEQLYNLVLDIEKYPEFLPWCNNAKILDRQEEFLIASLSINYMKFQEEYISKVYFTPHSKIRVELVEGPFEYLTNIWEFTPTGNESEISFDINFSFRSSMFKTILNMFFEQAAKKMIKAFEDRADFLYR